MTVIKVLTSRHTELFDQYSCVSKYYQKSLDFRLDSGSSWLDGVNGILKQQEPDSPKQDYWN
jgi:hypothetical protein